MEIVKDLGNIELLNCFLALHYRKFDLLENELANDPVAFYIERENREFLNTLLDTLDISVLYRALLIEATDRGLTFPNPIYKIYTQLGNSKEFIFTEEFYKWKQQMKENPTYIREIDATNYLGDRALENDFDLQILDFPVRESCKMLNERGYLTYWSSANHIDFTQREGHVIQDKTVAYILIDPKNLSTQLKEELFLNGNCDFWGLAVNHNDNGQYYGIWSEITSDTMRCSELSNSLVNRVLELPILEKSYSKKL